MYSHEDAAAVKKKITKYGSYSSATPMDNRPAINDLLKKHADELSRIKEQVSADNPLYDPERHDDIWLLRFLLSERKPNKAALTARRAMQYRHRCNLDSYEKLKWLSYHDIEDPMKIPEIMRPYHLRVSRGSIWNTQPNGDRGIIQYIRVAGVDMGRIADEVSEEEVRAFLRIAQEFTFRVLDEVTRRTGRLTKAIRLYDFEDMRLAKFYRRYVMMQGKIAKEIEDFYPQLNGGIFVFNAPTWMHYAYKLFKYAFPRRVVEKVEIVCSSRSPCSYGSLPEDSRLFEHISVDQLSSKYGGKSEQWPPNGTCGPPVSNGFDFRVPGETDPYTLIDLKALGSQ